MLIVLTGGVRSGKSRAAVATAASLDAPVTFIATAEPGDAEMAARIAQHAQQRPSGWATVEAPLDLSLAVERTDPKATLLIDCVSMWVANRMPAGSAAPTQEPEPARAPGAPADDPAPSTAADDGVTGDPVAPERRAAPSASTTVEARLRGDPVTSESQADQMASILADARDLGDLLSKREGTCVVVTNEVGTCWRQRERANRVGPSVSVRNVSEPA